VKRPFAEPSPDVRSGAFALGGQRFMAVSRELRGPPVELTAAEYEVACAAAAGHSNEAIATARGRSVRTVSNQIASVLAKLGFAHRRQLATHPSLVGVPLREAAARSAR
jgi:DNA-binding NarL/FixJ family response regulator